MKKPKLTIHELTIEHFNNIFKNLEQISIDYKSSKIPLNTIQMVLDKAKLETTKKQTENEVRLYTQVNNLIFSLFTYLIKKSRDGKVKLKWIKKAITTINKSIENEGRKI